MAYTVTHDWLPTDNGYWVECARCGKRRHGHYAYALRWFDAERDGAREIMYPPSCVWHDSIVNDKSDLW